MKIILASNNQLKIRELKSKLSSYFLNLEVYSLKNINYNEEIEEFGKTFEQNALIKAQQVSKEYPNYIVIGDDSGLEIKALNNEPSIYSARYAEDEIGYEENPDSTNIQKVLKKMDGESERKAKFITVLCVIFPNTEPLFLKGNVKGEIVHKKMGENGFGYDSIFSADGLKTFAQITDEEKEKISHRIKAVDKLIELLKEYNV